MERSSRHPLPRTFSEMVKFTISTTTMGNLSRAVVPTDVAASSRGPPGGNRLGTAGGILPSLLHHTSEGGRIVTGRSPSLRRSSSVGISASVSGNKMVARAPVLSQPGGARAGFRPIVGDPVPPKLRRGPDTRGSWSFFKLRRVGGPMLLSYQDCKVIQAVGSPPAR